MQHTFLTPPIAPGETLDVLIIGAGVTGCAIARELSRYRLSIAVVDALEDVAMGASRANSAIVHAGYDCVPGSMMARMNVRGNYLMDQWCRELGVPLGRIGSMVIAFNEADERALAVLYERGLKNGVPDMRIITGDEARRIEPQLSPQVTAALHAGTGAITCPYELTIACAENARANGVRFLMGAPVTAIRREGDVLAVTAGGMSCGPRREGTCAPGDIGGPSVAYEPDRACEPGDACEPCGDCEPGDACGQGGDACRPGGTASFRHASAPEHTLRARYVVNAAGAYADDIARMLGDESFAIHPRKGEYMLMDKSAANVWTVIFQTPSELGKGVLVSPTVDGNIFAGPTALSLDDKEDVTITGAGLAELKRLSLRSVPGLDLRAVITSFAGVRAHPSTDDFILCPSAAEARLIHAAGIASPGLTSAPAIAEYTAELLKGQGLALANKPEYSPGRAHIATLRGADDAGKLRLIAADPRYAQIICRCETVTEAEIIEAIRRGARSLDAVKRRTRAGMGRCQGGFCGPRVMEILSRELKVPMETLTKFGGDSFLLTGKLKEERT